MKTEVVYRVQENPDFIKDQSTGAVLNTNRDALKAYKARKFQSKKIEKLEQDMKDIKQILTVIMEKLQ